MWPGWRKWPRYRLLRVRPWQPAVFAAFLDQVDGDRWRRWFTGPAMRGLRGVL